MKNGRMVWVSVISFVVHPKRQLGAMGISYRSYSTSTMHGAQYAQRGRWAERHLRTHTLVLLG
jgi:hypothetical protein